MKLTLFAAVFGAVAIVLVAGLRDGQDQTIASAGPDAHRSFDSGRDPHPDRVADSIHGAATEPQQRVDATQIANPSESALHLPELFSSSTGTQSHAVFQVETITPAAPSTSASVNEPPETLTVDIDLENDRSF